MSGPRWPSAFDVRVIERPSRPPDHAFAAPGAGSRAVHIRVESRNAPAWTASVAAPEPGRQALSTLLGTPSFTGLCVVERGTAFLCDVLDPAAFTEVATRGPVVEEMALLSEGVLLLLTPWAITDIDASGVRWTTERIAIEGLRIDEVADGLVHGVADPDVGRQAFTVELATGRVTGGVGISGRASR